MDVPKPDRAVVAAGGERVPVRAERDSPDRLGSVVGELTDYFARSSVPEVHRPPVLADARVPGERRLVGRDAAPRPWHAGEAELDRARRDRSLQADEERVPGQRRVAEAADVAVVVVAAHLHRSPRVIHGLEQPERTGHDRKVDCRCERDLLAVPAARRRDLCPGRDHELVLRLSLREPERQVGGGSGGRKKRHAEQLEELHVVEIRHPVQPIEQLVGHPGERLDQHHARVGDVVVGPPVEVAVLLDAQLRFVDEILEAAVVEFRCGKCHEGIALVSTRASSPACAVAGSSGMT